MSFDTPILFTIYKRPGVTQLAFNAIRKISPKYLYVSADGPKSGEEEKCKAARDVIEQVDWDCFLYKNYQSSNLGGKWGGYSGIDWFFHNVDEGIILEDDDIPDITFFHFCETLLKKYRNDMRIGTISGDNFQFGNNQTGNSYYFSKYLHGWGWATWGRVWEKFDINMKEWPGTREQDILGDFTDDPREPVFWKATWDRMCAGDPSAWDYQFCYHLWKNKMLSILPSINLVTNLGDGIDSTHAMNANPMVNQPRRQMGFPLKHPTVIERLRKADLYTTQRFYL